MGCCSSHPSDSPTVRVISPVPGEGEARATGEAHTIGKHNSHPSDPSVTLTVQTTQLASTPATRSPHTRTREPSTQPEPIPDSHTHMVRAHSLMLPGESPSSHDLTASAKKRSSMRGDTKREIPPKSPTMPIRKSTAADRIPLDAERFPHAIDGQTANGHAGHHGYGPGNLANDKETANADASTQKINSNTSHCAMPSVDSPAGPEGASSPLTGTASGRGRKKLRRQTSHKGLLSRLALQFPLIKASFVKVHNVFERYHRERVLALSVLRDNSCTDQSNHSPTNATPTNKVGSSALSPPSDGRVGPSFISPESAVALSSSPLPLDPGHASRRQRKLTQQYRSEEISLDKLAEVLQHISGTTKTFADSEVRDLFQLADLDGSKTISFREFLIAVSIGYFLKVDSSAFPAGDSSSPVDPSVAPSASAVSSPPPPAAASSPASSSSRHIAHSSLGSEFHEIQKGFKVIEKAFHDIDEDGSNSVDVSELKKALFATSATKDQSILELRFEELDFNRDQSVSFAEFLFGITSWVSYDEEDETIGE